MQTLGESKIIPFQIAKDEDCNEALRLEYRFLDMREKKLAWESNFKIQGYCTSSWANDKRGIYGDANPNPYE